MGEKIRKKKKEYNPLDDANGLIGDILKTQKSLQKKVIEKPKQIIKPAQIKKKLEKRSSSKVLEDSQREESTVFRFNISKKDLYEVRRIIAEMELQTNSKIDLSSVVRGWVTRFITSEKELIDSARIEGSLKTPNRRDALEMSEFEHAMARIQARAFRRAGEI